MVTEQKVVSGLSTTVCPFCGVGCFLGIEGGAVYPLRHHPITQGALFLRGWSTAELFWSPLRLKTATVRNGDGTFVPTEVANALDTVNRKLRDIRNRYGSESIGILGSARLTTEENLLLRQLAVTLGTPNLDSFQRMGYLPLSPVPLESIDEAEKIIVLAVDIAIRHPQAGRRVLNALNQGAQVSFVDSRQVKFARVATEHLRPLPGHELNAAPLDDGSLTLLSSELALNGQGSKVMQKLNGRPTLFLTDYVNQRGMMTAGVYPFPEGLSAFEMLQKAKAGELKALLIFADDPFEFFSGLASEAFAKLELIMTVDAVETPTTRNAHIVLPGALFAEKQGTIMSADGRKQTIEPVIEPPTKWTEGKIAEQLLEMFGGKVEVGEIPPMTFGTESLEADTPTETHPFIISLDSGTFWNNHALIKASVTLWREMRAPFVDFPQGFITVNPEDAKELDIRMFAPLKIEGAEGGEITLPARIDERAGKGTLLLPMFLWEKVGKALGALQFDESLRIPVFRPTAVRIRK